MGRVDLVVITRNRRDLLATTIPRHLESLAEESEPGRLLIVDNASDDGTAGWVRTAYPDAGVIELSRNTGPAARNVGAAASRARYVAYSDDDSWWEPGSLDRAADILDEDPRLGLITGSVYVGEERRPDPLNDVLADSPFPPADKGGTPVLGFLALAAVVRRSAFLGVGGYPIGLGMGGEEAILAMDLAAAGWSLVFRPELEAQHHPTTVGSRPYREINMARNAMAIALARRRRGGMLTAMRFGLSSLDDPRSRLRALRGLWGTVPWVLRHRRPVPDGLEKRKRELHRDG